MATVADCRTFSLALARLVALAFLLSLATLPLQANAFHCAALGNGE